MYPPRYLFLEFNGAVGPLSRREREIADLVADGLTNREIATRLFISERTVDGHLEHVREKLGVNTRAQVAAWVVRQGAAAPDVPPAVAISRAAPRSRLVAHPRLWLATALVLALLAAGVGVLRLMEPPPPTIETFAGSECSHQEYPGGCFAGDDDLPTRAWLARPTDVAVDHNGVVYIADYANQRVRMVKDKRITTLAGGGTPTNPLVENALATSVSIGYASSIAVDQSNRLLVLTQVNGLIGVWRVNGLFMSLVVSLGRSKVPSLSAGLNMPLGGLAVAKDGTIYVAYMAGNQVLTYDGTSLRPFAGSGATSPLGDGAAALSAGLAWPIGLAFDGQENLYIADALHNRIRKIDRATGIITTVAGSSDLYGGSGDGGPAAKAMLSFPFGVAVGSNGAVVIADTGNHRLRIITKDGVIRPLAGTGQWGFSGDGSAAVQAQLSGPEAVAFDRKGDLLVADTENQRVREIPLLVPAQ